jgi:hypothetical protein
MFWSFLELVTAQIKAFAAHLPPMPFNPFW